jgi:hypothetical protein
MHPEATLTLDLLGLGEELEKPMRIGKKSNPRSQFFLLPEINHLKKSYLAATAPVRVDQPPCGA